MVVAAEVAAAAAPWPEISVPAGTVFSADNPAKTETGRLQSALFVFLEEAQELLEGGEFRALWRRGKELASHNWESHRILAIAASELGYNRACEKHLRKALRHPDVDKLEVYLSWSELSPSGAESILDEALKKCPESSPQIWLEIAYLRAQRVAWTAALEAVEQGLAWDPEDTDLLGFKSQILVRLGRGDEALKLLESRRFWPPEEQHRRSWLRNPGKRLQPIGEVEPVLHPLFEVRSLHHLTIQPYGTFPTEVLHQIEQFHGREFPNSKIEFLAAKPAPEESFEQLRDRGDVGELPDWIDRSQLALVLANPLEPTPYSAGIGTPEMVVVAASEGDPFLASIVAHELYHAVLGLTHTDGLEGPDDPTSLLGEWGTRTPLLSTHIHQEHRQACSTTLKVEKLVKEHAWNEALELDPDYFGLYPKAAHDLILKQDAEGALAFLAKRFKRDPGPEAAAPLAELRMHLRRSPNRIFERTLGYGYAANTHLYFAQACLDAGCWRRALTQLKMAFHLAPGNLHGLGMAGWAHHRLGHRRAAGRYYREALKRLPGWERVQLQLAWLTKQTCPLPKVSHPFHLWLYSQIVPRDQALDALASVSDQKNLHRRAYLWFQEGFISKAERDFQAAQKLHPFTLEGQASRAWLAFLVGQPEAYDLGMQVLRRWSREPSSHELAALIKPLRGLR